MLKYLSTLLLVFLIGCGPAEIKSYKDLVANDAVAIVLVKNENEFKKLLSNQFKSYFLLAKPFFPFIDPKREIAVGVMNLKGGTSYAALPILEGKEEEALGKIPEWTRDKCVSRSGYLFVPIKGKLPSSFGQTNITFDSQLAIHIDSENLLKQKDDVKHFAKKSSFWTYLNLMPEFSNTIREILAGDGLDLLQLTQQIDFKVNKKGKIQLSAEVKFKDEVDVEKLSALRLPENPLENSIKLSLNYNPEAIPSLTSALLQLAKTTLRVSGNEGSILALIKVRKELSSGENFSMISGLNSDSPEKGSFVLQSKKMSEFLKKYFENLLDSSIRISEKHIAIGELDSLTNSKEAGIFYSEIDMLKETELKERIDAGCNFTWNVIKGKIQSRISNSLVRAMIQSLQPMKVDLSTIKAKVRAENKSIILDVEY